MESDCEFQPALSEFNGKRMGVRGERDIGRYTEKEDEKQSPVRCNDDNLHGFWIYDTNSELEAIARSRTQLSTIIIPSAFLWNRYMSFPTTLCVKPVYTRMQFLLRISASIYQLYSTNSRSQNVDYICLTLRWAFTNSIGAITRNFPTRVKKQCHFANK